MKLRNYDNKHTRNSHSSNQTLQSSATVYSAKRQPSWTLNGTKLLAAIMRNSLQPWRRMSVEGQRRWRVCSRFMNCKLRMSTLCLKTPKLARTSCFSYVPFVLEGLFGGVVWRELTREEEEDGWKTRITEGHKHEALETHG